MRIFLNDCPELVIVDEVHTCAKPAGATSNSRQQCYRLLYEIAKKESQHLVLLTATPHCGKDEKFKSLLGLLNREFESYALGQIDQSKRCRIARHFIQRKRENIARWQRTSIRKNTVSRSGLQRDCLYPVGAVRRVLPRYSSNLPEE